MTDQVMTVDCRDPGSCPFPGGPRTQLGAAADRLEEAAGLPRATENERDLRVVRQVLNLMRQRWPGAAEVRRIDELLRSST